MSAFDIVLLIIIGGFGTAGFMFGFIHTFGSLLGTVFGVYLASRYYDILADLLIGILGWGGNGIRFVMFVIAFLIINRLVGLLFWFISKTLKLAATLMMLNIVNRILGVLFGIFEGVVTIGIAIYFIDKYPLSQKLMEMIVTSDVAPYTLKVANMLLPLLPKAMQVLKSSVDFVEGKVL